MRGVTRKIHINDDVPKKRFLMFLAYNAHSAESRQRTFNDALIEVAFEDALGSVGYRLELDDLIEDLVLASGIIIKERKGVYSLGHLSFQEHLAGTYLHERMQAWEIYELMGEDWWREPLNFYASKKGDITDLINFAQERGEESLYRDQFVEMVGYAPFTSAGAKDVLSI
jgi:hypothetical protein